MIVKLSITQFSYLKDYLNKDEKNLKFKFSEGRNGKSKFIEINKDTANEIRDLASEELQKSGFDENYELNEEGKVLESLIDIFFVK